MKSKRICALAVLALLAFALAGCGRWGIFSGELDFLLEEGPGQYGGPGYGYDIPDDDEAYEGYGESYTGALGDVMRSCFFDFVVEEPELLAEYGGYAAPEGWQLLKTRISVYNTFGEELPMSIYDFQIQWGPGDDDFGYEAEAFCEMDGCMPEFYQLAADESVVYNVIYEVPAGSTEFSVSYLEYFSDDTTGDVFFVYFSAESGVSSTAYGGIEL